MVPSSSIQSNWVCAVGLARHVSMKVSFLISYYVPWVNSYLFYSYSILILPRCLDFSNLCVVLSETWASRPHADLRTMVHSNWDTPHLGNSDASPSHLCLILSGTKSHRRLLILVLEVYARVVCRYSICLKMDFHRGINRGREIVDRTDTYKNQLHCVWRSYIRAVKKATYTTSGDSATGSNSGKVGSHFQYKSSSGWALCCCRKLPMQPRVPQ